MAISFIEALKNMKMAEFQFVNFEMKIQGDENDRAKYLQFELAEPMDKVTSSMTVSNGTDSVHLFITDVTHINCRLDVIEANEHEFTFEMDAEGKVTRVGSYAGDLFLDVSRGEEAWLTDQRFSKMGREWGNKKRMQQNAKFFTKK